MTAAHTLTAAVNRTAAALDQLATRPFLLLAVCLALNAIFMPYEGITRDANQYSAQVIQAGTGRFSDDLFFKYGDQSSRTVFPVMLAGPASWFGFQPVFFVVYMLVNAGRLWAAQRLILRVLGPSPGAVVGVLMAAAAIVPIGWGTLAVNEPVLTARAPAVAASLFALDCLLAHQPIRAIIWLIIALVLHPLIAAPAAAVALGWVVLGWATNPRRRMAVGIAFLVALVGAAAYLVKTAGTLDPAWRSMVMRNNAHVDPAKWDPLTWTRLLFATGCALIVARTRSNPADRRFLVLIVVAAVAGLLVATIAAQGSWALVFQVQAARTVWLLELFWYPLIFVTISQLWTSGGRVGAVALLILLLVRPYLSDPGSIPLLVGGILVGWVVFRAMGAAEWMWRGLATGLLLWGCVWFSVFAPAQYVAGFQSGPFFGTDFSDWIVRLHEEFGLYFRLIIVMAMLALVGAVARPSVWAVGAVAVWIAASFATYLLPQTEWAKRRTAPRPEDIQLVRTLIARTWTEDRPPTVYWPRRMNTIWFDLEANSYFTYWQLSPNIFFRGNAVEGARRWQLTAPFEVDHEHPKTNRGMPRPTSEQFRALVADPLVDFAVLPYDFGGSIGSNGLIWVYDARVSRLAQPAPPRGTANGP